MHMHTITYYIFPPGQARPPYGLNGWGSLTFRVDVDLAFIPLVVVVVGLVVGVVVVVVVVGVVRFYANFGFVSISVRSPKNDNI